MLAGCWTGLTDRELQHLTSTRKRHQSDVENRSVALEEFRNGTRMGKQVGRAAAGRGDFQESTRRGSDSRADCGTAAATRTRALAATDSATTASSLQPAASANAGGSTGGAGGTDWAQVNSPGFFIPVLESTSHPSRKKAREGRHPHNSESQKSHPSPKSGEGWGTRWGLNARR
jgi:hypothetical protein